MPTTYAHWHFGAECIELMPKYLQKIVHENRDIYNFGVHGPDMFFYKLNDSQLVSFGFHMHKVPFSAFVDYSKRAYKETKYKDEMLAYLVGFLTHFTLDSSLHSYIEKKTDVGNVSHNRIEAQWDRHLIVLDNRQPNLVDRSESLKPTKKLAIVISELFNFSPRRTLSAMRWHKFIIRLLNCITIRKQKFLIKALTKAKKYKYIDLLLDFEEDEKCKDSNLRLDKLKEEALKKYRKLLKNYIGYMDGKEKLDPYFKHDLDEWPDYKKIKILPYEKELKYKV